jgi:chromosome segregation ATPase
MEQTLKAKFQRELDALTTIRDELRLKAHLAQKDVQDELRKLESRLGAVDEELGRVKTHTKVEIERLGADFKELFSDLKQSFESVKKRLS